MRSSTPPNRRAAAPAPFRQGDRKGADEQKRQNRRSFLEKAAAERRLAAGTWRRCPPVDKGHGAQDSPPLSESVSRIPLLWKGRRLTLQLTHSNTLRV